VEPRLGLGRPAWADAPEVDLTGTWPNPRMPTRSRTKELRHAVGDLLSERLDHTRPLWRLDALPLPGTVSQSSGESITPWRRVSAIRLTAGLLWDEDSPSPPPLAHTRRQARPPQPPRAPRTARGRGRARRASWCACPPPSGVSCTPGRCRRSIRHIGPGREVSWTTFPLQRLKRIEHGAATASPSTTWCWPSWPGGLRRLDRGRQTTRHTTLRVQCPVCLHALKEEKGQLGKPRLVHERRFALAEEDPVRAPALDQHRTRERKFDHDADTLYAFFHAIGRFSRSTKG